MINQYEFKSIIQRVSLSPTAHNTQPFRWGLNNNIIKMTIDSKRKLPIADPSDHDLWISAGCIGLGLKIELNDRGLKVSDIKIEEDGITYVVSEESELNHEMRDLSASVEKRYCHRDIYKKKTSFDKNDLSVLDSKNSSFIKDSKVIKKIAKAHDKSTYFFLKKEEYFKELCMWLRLRQKSENYHWDGINLCSMGFNFLEKFFAKYVMSPKVFSFLKMISLGEVITAEASKVATSSGLMAIHIDTEASNLEAGEVFYKKWLEMTALGYTGSPLSTLIDHPKYNKKCREWFNIPSNHKLINILKVGPTDLLNQPKRCRLPIEKIIED